MSEESPTQERLWHPAAAFDLSAAYTPALCGPDRRPYFAEKAWGASLANHIYGLPEHVHAHLRVLPEGILLHADCARCSQRHEVALDFRAEVALDFRALDESDGYADTTAVELHAFGAERARWLQLGLWQDEVREWAAAHESCRIRRGPPALEARRRVATVVEELQATATTELIVCGAASPVVALVPEEGAPVRFDATGTRRCDRMLTGFRVREVVRFWPRPPAAVLVLEEVVVRERATLLRLGLLTARACWVGYAVVDRFGRPWPGPGRVGRLAWSPIREAATWLDGLLVRRMPFPVPRVLAPMEKD